MQESGQLRYVNRNNESFLPSPELDFGILFVNGHTEKQMIPHISYKGKTVVFVADLIPTVGHIPLPYIMGYDTRPLLTLEEKSAFLIEAVEKEYLLFFEHDAHTELCSLEMTEKGIRLGQKHSFNEIFN